MPIGQASRESNLPKAKNYLSLTIGQDFFRALAFSFSSLTPTEESYGQTEKKALAITHGFQKFDQLLFGKFDFPVQSDHKPLETGRFNVSRCRKSLTLFVRDLFTI